MFCEKCGKQSEGTDFCPYCGDAMQTQRELTSISESVKGSGSKRKKWAVLGICVGAVVILAVALFFILTTPVTGQWYNEDRGEVIALNQNGTLQLICLSNTLQGDFDYQQLSGNGSCNIGDTSYNFITSNQQIQIDGLGDYTKAGKDFDIDEFINKYGYLGSWYSEDRGEVLVFDTDGALQSIHMSSVNDAIYDYDREKGKGTITLGTLSFQMQYTDGMLNISDMGEFSKAAEGFEVDSFIDDHGDSVLGLWFDPEGENIYNLFDDGTCSIVSYENEKESTYSVTDTGITINVYAFDDPIPFDYNLKDGILLFGDGSKHIMSRDYTEQKTAEQIYDEIVGKYEDTNGNTLELFKDGSSMLTLLSIEIPLTISYEPLGAFGYLIVQDENAFFEKGKELTFVKQDEESIMLGTAFFYKQ